MKGSKEAYKSIFHYYNEHRSHENSFYISLSNLNWIYFIPNQSFMNILHGYKLLRLPLYTFLKIFQVLGSVFTFLEKGDFEIFLLHVFRL